MSPTGNQERRVGGRTALLLLITCCCLGAAEDERALARRLVAAYVFVGGGSGVVVSADGLVLTNHHVIDHMDDGYGVIFADGVERGARLLGTDPVGDIAVLRIDGDAPEGGWPHVPFAPAEALRPGIEVLAIGNPFSLGGLDNTPTVTRGVLSLGRVVREDYTDAIQGDAPVNPGNSGGPLFDLQGRLLGINGQIRSRTGFRVNSGIGLAIASPQLSAFLAPLSAADGGFVRHTAAPKDLEFTDGPDGPLVAKAPAGHELKAGDRVLAIAGRPATSAAVAKGLCAAAPWSADARIAVRLRRDGAELDLSIAAGRTPIPGRPYHGWSVDEREGGAGKETVIDHVDEDSPAHKAGIRAGDVIRSVNGRAITSKVSLLRAMLGAEIGDDLVVVLVVRGGDERTVTLRLARAE